MLVQKTLTATITIDNFEPGYTYEFVVLSTNCPEVFEENEVLCSGDITTATSTLVCDTGEYEALSCTILVIGLKIKKDADECSRILFDLVNDETSPQKHYRCVLSNEGDTTACEEFPGVASGSNEFPTLEACQECTGCPCNPDITPCDTLTFTAEYECSTEGAPNPGTLTFCITEGITPGSPVILNGFTLVNASGSVVYTDNDTEVFTVNGQCKTVANIYLIPGSYVVTAYFNTSVCPESTTQFTFNCPMTPPPPPTDGITIQCCATTGAAGANSVGNVGNINCYTLVYPSDMDTNEDIVIDFGANGVADKLEIYRGIVSCQDIATGELIASTPYIGTLTSTKSGYCHNVAPNFLPAIGSPSDPENTVVQGCWTGNNQLGPYHPSSNPGVVIPYNPPLTNGSVGLSNPSWADDLHGFNPTHTLVSSNPPVYAPANGMGGMEHGRGRLRIKGGTYADASNSLTVVVHNNGSVLPGIPGNGLCGTNTTAWKFYVHCPACPECEGNFTVTPGCISTYKGKVDIAITGDYQSPVNVYITPSSVSWLFSLLEQGVPYLYRSSNNTYYELSHIDLPGEPDYLQTTINDDISAGDTLRFCKVHNGITYIDADVNDGVWTIQITDGVDCNTTLYPDVDCPCSISHTLIGNNSVCIGTPLYLTLTINGTQLCNVIQNTEFTGLPAFLEVTNATGNANQLVIKKKAGAAQVAGTYTVHFVYDCGYGCFLEDDIQIIIKDFTCSVSASVNGTTCGNNNGSIALTLCGGATVLWNTGSTNTTISGLAPGVYIATVTGPNACTQTFSYTIGSDSPVTFTVVDETLDCTTPNAASILVDNINGGTAPYTINLWNSDLVLVFGPQVVAGPGPVDYTILHASVTGGLVPDTYKVAVTDANGCETAYNVIIDQEVAPELSVSSSSTTCGFNNGIITAYATPTTATQTIYYAAAGDIDCNDLSAGTVASVGAPATIWSMYAGDYTVCVEDSANGCCVCEDITVVATSTPPTAPTVNNRTICAGGSVTLSGSCPGGGNITWYYDSDGTQVIPFSTISNILVTTTYYAQCSSGGCASTLTPLLVTVIQPPQVNAGPDKSRCASGNCNASSVSLTGSCPGCLTCTGQWYLGTDTVGSGATISVAPSTTSNYIYRCTKPGSPSCYNTDTALVTVMTPPVVTTQNISSCTPILSFSGVVTSPVGGNYTYTYYKDTTCTLPTSGTVTGITNYSVKVTDVDTGCCTCAQFQVTQATNAPLSPTYSYNCNANTFTLSVPAATGCTYSWTKQGSATVLGVTSTLTLPYVPGTSNGNYVVTATCGACVSTGTVNVNVTTSAITLIPQTFCAAVGSTYPIVPSISGVSVGNYTYTISNWTGTGPTPAPASGTLPLASPITISLTNSGDFDLTISFTTANGCIVTQTASYSIAEKPEITVNSICNSGALTWGDVITDYDPLNAYYLYVSPVTDPCSSGGGIQIFDITAISPTLFNTVKIKVINSDGCCNSISVGLTPPVHLISSYTCTGSTTDNISNIILTITPQAAVNYSYSVFLTGFNETDGSSFSQVVTIPSGTVAPQTVTIFGTTSGSWNIFATSGCGWGDCGACTYLAPLNVSCCPTTTPTYTYNCATNSITLAVNAGTCSGNPCSVSWTKQGSPTVIGTSATLIYNTAPLNGTYIATVNCCGCISTGSVTVTTTPPPTITLPADVSFCKGVGTYSVPVSLSGLTNFTWTSTWSGSAATYPITATCNSGCTSPIQVSKANSGVLTITVSGTSANGCVVTDSMTITITDGPLLTLQDACKTTDNTWQDVITDYNPLYTYYWGPSTMPNLTTCGSGVGFQITNPSQSLTATGASGLITIRAEYQGCCKFANANIFLQPHLTLFGVQCTPSQNDNLAAVHLYLVPGNYFGVPYNITVTGTNLSDNTVVSTVVPINNAVQQTVSFPSVTSGSWEFIAYIGTNANMPAAACPFVLEVPVECCSACSAGTWTTATRTLYVGIIPPGAAQPYNATIKFPAVFSAGNVLQNKILNTDQITVRIYDDSLALVSTIGPHPVKDGGGLSITGNFVIDGITTNGDYFIETEAATSGGTVYSRTVQNLTVSGGGHTLASDTNTVFFNQAGIDPNYTLTLTMCNKGEIIPRVDGTYTITNVPTGQETVFSSCADGFENILLPAVVVPTSVIRLQYECLDSCSGCWGGCVSCASIYVLSLRRSSISPLFVDNFIYCYNS